MINFFLIAFWFHCSTKHQKHFNSSIEIPHIVVRLLNDGDNHGTLNCENLGYFESAHDSGKIGSVLKPVS